MASARQSADGSQPARPWLYQPLAPDEIRWYWATGPLSLKSKPNSALKAPGSVYVQLLNTHRLNAAWYKADILSRGSYLRFCRTDSLSMEMAYRYHWTISCTLLQLMNTCMLDDAQDALRPVSQAQLHCMHEGIVGSFGLMPSGPGQP